MKRLVLLFLMAGFVVSCTKLTSEQPVPNASGYLGKWEMKHRYGGNILPADTIYPTGNGNILLLKSDFTYTSYAKGNVVSRGIYQITKKGYTLNQTTYDEILFDGNLSGALISLNGGLLTIKPLLADISTVDYQLVQ